MTPNEERELLLKWRPWLRKVASGICRTFPQWSEDLAAEGWIEVWRTLKDEEHRTHPAPLDYYIKRRSLRRMLQVVHGWKAQCRDVRQTTLTDPLVLRDELWTQFDADFDAVEWAYHQGEIARCVSQLPAQQRQYVIRRFWHNWPTESLSIYFDDPDGYPRTKFLWRSAKSRLKADLTHLSEVT